MNAIKVCYNQIIRQFIQRVSDIFFWRNVITMRTDVEVESKVFQIMFHVYRVHVMALIDNMYTKHTKQNEQRKSRPLH